MGDMASGSVPRGAPLLCSPSATRLYFSSVSLRGRDNISFHRENLTVALPLIFPVLLRGAHGRFASSSRAVMEGGDAVDGEDLVDHGSNKIDNVRGA